MIFDNIKNIEKYFCLGENIKKGLECMAAHGDLEVGSYEVDGDKVICKVQKYTTKTANNPSLENHRKYIDIQYIHRGVECAEIGSKCEKYRESDYNEIKDVEFFNPKQRSAKLLAKDGDFFILFPGETHCAGLSADKDCEVKKVVVKVLY